MDKFLLGSVNLSGSVLLREVEPVQALEIDPGKPQVGAALIARNNQKRQVVSIGIVPNLMEKETIQP